MKHEHIRFRIDARTKRTLERAAAYEETTLTDFVLDNALKAAERVIESRERITLSAADWEVFYDALLDPPEPNQTLKAAVRRYRELVGG